MNNQTNRQVGRLTGRTEVDAGLMRYRQQLATGHHSVVSQRGSGQNKLLGLSLAWQRKAAAVVAAALVFVVALAIVGASREAEMGASCLTPGYGGSGTVASSVERAPVIAFIDETGAIAGSGGSFEYDFSGEATEDTIMRYNGELCCGPYVLAP